MKEYNPNEITYNIYDKFNNDWALVMANHHEKNNPMTISWGTTGILWNKPVMQVYVRNTRYTKPLMDGSSYYSVSFFEKDFHEALVYCGTKSGKNEDKIAKCRFHIKEYENVKYIEEASITYIMKKIYQVDLPINEETDSDIKKHYKPNELHTMYIGEIIKVITK